MNSALVEQSREVLYQLRAMYAHQLMTSDVRKMLNYDVSMIIASFVHPYYQLRTLAGDRKFAIILDHVVTVFDSTLKIFSNSSWRWIQLSGDKVTIIHPNFVSYLEDCTYEGSWTSTDELNNFVGQADIDWGTIGNRLNTSVVWNRSDKHIHELFRCESKLRRVLWSAFGVDAVLFNEHNLDGEGDNRITDYVDDAIAIVEYWGYSICVGSMVGSIVPVPYEKACAVAYVLLCLHPDMVLPSAKEVDKWALAALTCREIRYRPHGSSIHTIPYTYHKLGSITKMRQVVSIQFHDFAFSDPTPKITISSKGRRTSADKVGRRNGRRGVINRKQCPVPSPVYEALSSNANGWLE